MNWALPVPTGSSATRCPVPPETKNERLLARRAARLSGRRMRADMVYLAADPSGDFTLGMSLSLGEIAYGLKDGVWQAGTVFLRNGQRLTVAGDGQLLDPDGDPVILVAGIGR